MIDSSSVRVEERLTDNGVVVVQVFGEPLLGYRLLIELDMSLCEEVVVGLITCEGELIVLGSPTPQRQCAWLLSTYLKEGEEQKEVLEAKDDEEKESEIDGEVGERESHSTRA